MLEADFKCAMDAAGLPTKDAITVDSRLHRFHIEGDSPGSRNGWYILYGDSLPAGAFGSWKHGVSGKWCAKSEKILTPSERREFTRRMEEARKAREAEEAERRRQVREKALFIWKTATPAPDDYPYLLKKGVQSDDLWLHNGALVLPLRDSAGTLHSLQFIDNEGNKRFLSGGRKKGCFFLIGSPTDSLCICEG